MPTINNFADLKKVSRTLKAEAKAREAAQKAAREKEERARREANQFAAAMADMGIRRMPQKDLADTRKPKPAPIARSVNAEKDDVMRAAMSDHADPTVFLESDDGMLYRRQGVSPDIPRKLYRGEWTVEAHIDLHGMRVDEAREAVADFLRESQLRGYRCLRIVHGKGHGSEGGQSVLREMVRRWLKQRIEVMAFVQTPPADGDSGAVRVLISAGRKEAIRPLC